MSGYKLMLPVTFSGTSLPVLPGSDGILSNGSLVLLDPTNLTAAWAAGTPTNNQAIINLAGANAKTLINTSLDSDVNAVAYVPAAFVGAVGLLERTAKGGLHGISSQAGNAIAASGPVIALPTKLIKYLLDNHLHTYYFSLWARPTRLPKAGFAAMAAISGNGQQTNSGLFYAQASSTLNGGWGSRPNVTPPLIGSRIPATTMAPTMVSVATNGWYFNNPITNPAPIPGDGTQVLVTGSYAGGGIFFGSSAQVSGIGATGTVGMGIFSFVGTIANKDLAGSHVFYRMYLEDLTVSGRSYSTVDAIDYTMFQAAMTTAGGRYYGDTFTDPATIP